MSVWYELETIRTDWRDAPQSDTVLQQLLDTAKQQVLDFDNGFNYRKSDTTGEPWSGDYTDVPNNLVLAQRMQARNLWNASKVDPGNGAMGDDTFVLRPFPMDWVVKNVIRPKSPVAVFG